LRPPRRAEKLGFTRPHIVNLETFGREAGEGLNKAISAGHHASMAWLAETAFRRSHPRNLWPDAKSAVIFGMNYGPDSDPMVTLQTHDVGTISVYARGRDYHDIMKGRLKELAGLLARDTGEDVKIFVDTAPLMEKPLAMAADDCLAVCPWNKFAKIGREAKLAAREDLNAPKLAELAKLGEIKFRKQFSKSPIKRIGWARFLRNVLYAIGNSADPELKPLADANRNHPDSVVADAAKWASQKLHGI